MRQPLQIFALVTVLVLGFGCSAEGGDTQPAAGAVPEAGEPESMDPGLLRSIMINLGSEMNEISRALSLGDLPTLAAAATAIAEHPHVSDTERERIQAVLGSNFGSFVSSDRQVHETSVHLSEAAAANDLPATLEQLAELQVRCVACHQEFRERLR